MTTQHTESLRTDAPATEHYLSAEEILERVRALGPLLEEESDAVDRARALTPRVLEALREAGVFRIGWPAAWGGPELNFEQQVELVAELAYHDASVAWNVQILTDTGFYGGQLHEEHARELYPSIDFATAGAFYPPGRADRVDGGWQVSGQWPFGSGIHSADRVVGGVNLYENGEPLFDADGNPEFRVVYLPEDRIELLDTWHVTGIRGSGSTDYRVHDVFVPDGRMFEYFSAGDAEIPPLSRHPNTIAISLQGVAIGLGRRYLDDARKTLQAQNRSHDRYERVVLAEAETRIQSARAFSMASAREVDSYVFSGQNIPSEIQATQSMAMVNAGHATHDAIERVNEILGSQVIYERSPFERRRRDALVLLAHVSHQRRMLEIAGGKLLGESDLPRLA